MRDLRGTIITILREQPLNPDTLGMLADPPADFDISEVALSSLDALVFCMEIENAFDIAFEAPELERLPRYSDLVAHVASRLPGEPAE